MESEAPLADLLPGEPGEFPSEPDRERCQSQLPGEHSGSAVEGRETLQPAAVPVSTTKPKVTDDDALDPSTAQDLLELLLSAEAPPSFPEQEYVVLRADRSMHVKVRLRGLSDLEMERIGERCFRDATPREKKLGAGDQVRDQARLARLTVTEAMVHPPLTDPRVLAKWGPTPEDVVKQWFLPGEIDKMGDQVNDLSGWGEEALSRIKGS